MKNKGVPQDGDCLVVVSDRGNRHSFSCWTCRFRVKIVFPFTLSIRQITGNYFNNRERAPNRNISPRMCTEGSSVNRRCGPKHKKNPRNLKCTVQLLAKSSKSKMYNYSRSELCPHRLMTQGSSCRQYVDAGINPIIPAFRSLWLSGRSSCPVNLTVLRSFRSPSTKRI